MENNFEILDNNLEGITSELIKTIKNISKFHVKRITSRKMPGFMNPSGNMEIVVNCLKANELPKLENIQRAYIAQVILSIYNVLNVKGLKTRLRNEIDRAISARQIVKIALDSLMTETAASLIIGGRLRHKKFEVDTNLQEFFNAFEQNGEDVLSIKHLLKVVTKYSELTPEIRAIFGEGEVFLKRLKKCLDLTVMLMNEKSQILECTDNELKLTFKNYENGVYVILGKDFSLDSLSD